MGGRPWQPMDTMTKKMNKFVRALTGILLLSTLLSIQAFALEVPVSQTEQMVDGRQTLVRVYEVTPGMDPETLIENDLSQNGYIYAMTSITKDTVIVEDEKEITQEQAITIAVSDENDARLEALKSMPAFIEYEKDGYIGKLYPVIASFDGQETGRTSHSGSKRITKAYTYAYNDDSLVPASSDGYSLSSITWAEGADPEGTGIPTDYTATATYAKRYSYSTVDGWVFSMSYVGDVEYEHEDIIRYTLTYTGTQIEQPGFWASLFGAKAADPDTPGDTGAGVSPLRIILGIICAAAALAAVVVGVILLVRFLRNNRVVIYARDEVTGEYSVVEKVWFHSKTATVTIDTLAVPGATHFRVSFKPALAEALKGKVVTIKTGQHVCKHQISDAGGTDYTIDINLDAME